MAQKIGISYCETSAKHYENTFPAFNNLIEKIIHSKRKEFGFNEQKPIKLSNQKT